MEVSCKANKSILYWRGEKDLENRSYGLRSKVDATLVENTQFFGTINQRSEMIDQKYIK